MKRCMMLLMSVCTLALVSCGGKSKTVSMREIDIFGDVGDDDADEYFKIDGGSFKFSIEDDKLVVALPIKTIKKVPYVILDEIDDFYVSVFGPEKLIKTQSGDGVYMELEDVKAVNKLRSSNVNDVNIVKFQYVLLGETAILDQIESFDVTIDLVLPEDDDNYSGKTNSEDWDTVLDSYESYIDQYIALYKKAQAGDMSAMSEYATFIEKATELSEKLGNSKDDMSSAQISRFVKLQAKLTAGMQ